MPSRRWLVAVACIALLLGAVLIGRGRPTAGADVIGARSLTQASPAPASFDTTPIAYEFASELNAINNTQAIGPDVLAPGELPIDSVLTIRQAERLAVKQTLGSILVSRLLTAIAQVRSQISTDPAMSAYQKYTLFGPLDAAAASVSRAGVAIARDQIVDQARMDYRTVYALRIGGFVLLQARLTSAGYDLGHLAAVYSSQAASIQQRIYAAEAYGKDASVSQADVYRLSAQVAAMNRYSADALAMLQGLSASGYPGNKGSLIGARQALNAGEFAASEAARDAANALSSLP